MLPVNCNQIPIASGVLSRKNSSNSDDGSCKSRSSKSSKRRSSSSINKQTPTATIPFPWKLHRILDEADAKGFNDVISWVPSENGFKVHKTKVFDDEIMPKYFDKTKYKSFQRQLNMWGFDRVGSGPYKGAYLHSCFVRGQPQLCESMQRTKIKGIHSKKLRKNSLNGDLLGGGSNHSRIEPLGRGSNHSMGDPLGGGSNHSSSSMATATSSNVSNIDAMNMDIRASIKASAQKLADLERQKEEIQRKLEMVSSKTMKQDSLEDDFYQPLPLFEGDSLLFGGSNFFFLEDGKPSEELAPQQRRRAGRRYSLELKAPDSDEYVLKELDDKNLWGGMDAGSNQSSDSNLEENMKHALNRIKQSSGFNSDIMAPTPLPPNLDVVTATTNISNRNSSLVIGFDKPRRRFSFLSTPVHNPFEKPLQIQQKPSSMSSDSMMYSDLKLGNINNKMMSMNMNTNDMMHMNMYNQNINYLNARQNSLSKLLKISSRPSMNAV